MEKLNIGLAQIHPEWLNQKASIQKIITYIKKAKSSGCDLIVFGEALLPGYPFWVEHTDGAKFNNTIQKEIHALYQQEAIRIERGDLLPILEQCKTHKIACVLGIIERPADRGGHSLYCTLVYIDKNGIIQSTHRKLRPTYEERLVWSPGDGHGLRTHQLGPFTLGALNCWENWMPLPRAALYAQGEDLHIAIWPGSDRNTRDITRFIALESRSYVVSVSGLMSKDTIPKDFPYFDLFYKNCPSVMANGGSAVAAPDGSWLLEPQVGNEGLFVVEIDYQKIRKERHNFDPAGHYSRPDVTQLLLNQERQSTLKIKK